ncbi:MAG TPA: hypothetical protein VH165_02390 [Kofleriaceae bacterium]|jgi:hypothetical protein|nr:hypothetical protein [Kofleriaceae bacterium]
MEWAQQRHAPAWKRRVAPYTYKIAGSQPDRIREVARPTGLAALLTELLEEPFAERAVRLPPVREERVLREDPLVRRLILALKLARDGERQIERFLDNVFQDLKKGELFRHSEAVMALLVAIWQAEVAWFPKIADALASSNFAEIGRVARLAGRLHP